MVLSYKFKKQKIEDGFIMRLIIPVTLEGKIKIDTTALIDTGCDLTLVPESLAEAVGLKIGSEINEIYGYAEKVNVVDSRATLTFLSRNKRDEKTITIPVSVVKKQKGVQEETELILGINGMFDKFDIDFQKNKNKIIFKSVEGS